MLSAKQVKCLNLLLLGEMTQVEIAKELQVSENTISNWKKNEEFATEFDRMMRQSINATCSRALRTMIGLLNSDSDSVRFQASKDLLDRAGYKAIEKLEVDANVDPIVLEMDVRE